MVWMFPSQIFAASTARLVGEGNKYYKNQKYNDALGAYDQALSSRPDSSVINFNVGAAQFKTGDYQQAIRSFEKSLVTEDKNLEVKANYNLANSKYMLGLSKENTDSSSALNLLEGALGNYKRTIELAPKDKDAKINYELTEKRLKELKEKLEQQKKNQGVQKQEQQNKEQKQRQEEEGRQKQEQEKQEQAKQEENKATNKQEQANQSQQQQAQEQAGQQKQEEENAQQQQATGQLGELKEMSKEEANMLLEGYRQEENVAGKLQDERKGTEEKVLKDW